VFQKDVSADLAINRNAMAFCECYHWQINNFRVRHETLSQPILFSLLTFSQLPLSEFVSKQEFKP